MNIVPRAHVSDAIKQLRGWVTLAATLVGLACATQMFVFGFAAYTEVRWDDVKPAVVDRSLVVVGSAPATEPHSAEGATKPAAGAAPMPMRTAAAVPAGTFDSMKKPVEANRVKSPTDLLMHRASDLAASIGVVSVVCLFVVTMLGAIVAGGGAVPGVERAVTSAVWSMILCLLCLPWNRALPGLGVQGVFATYGDMAWALDARGVGHAANVPLGLAMQWIAAPVCGMFAAMGVAIWFRAGVERGVLVTSPNDLEKAVVREAAMIQKRGVATSAPKAVGALHHAIGAGAPPAENGRAARGAPAGTLSVIEQSLNDKELVGAVGTATRPVARGKPSGGVADEDFRRPI